MKAAGAAIAVAACAALAGCAGERRGLPDSVDVTHADSVAPLGLSATELDSAARDVLAFLRGEADFSRIRLADTVTLYLSPEGGATRATLAREHLRQPSDWVIGSGRQGYSFVPPAGKPQVTTKVGRHLNCREYSLASRFDHLASMPHVGVMMQPERAESCLQTWNITLVFDEKQRPPTLVAAVYDQWEW